MFVKQPETVRLDMIEYRRFGYPVPQSYIDWQNHMASLDIPLQVAAGNFVVVEDHGVKSDGWAYGMKVRFLTIAYRATPESKWQIGGIRWHDSAITPAWFLILPSGGAERFLKTYVNIVK